MASNWKRRALQILPVLFLIFGFISSPLLAQSAVWTGGQTEPVVVQSGDTAYPQYAGYYKITSGEELAWFAQTVNAGQTAINGFLAEDILLNDLDTYSNWAEAAPANAWTAIGSNTNKYTGTFDGNGHIVSGIYIQSSVAYQGVFGTIGAVGSVKNLGVASAYICYTANTNNMQYGGITGYNEGLISGCFFDGTVSAPASAANRRPQLGGIAGYNSGTISDCYNLGTISTTGNRVGGIVAFNTAGGSIVNCYNKGAVSAASVFGSICGFSNNATITNCYYPETAAADEKAAVRTAAEFADGTVLGLLGNAFAIATIGESDVNGGFPILKWQIKDEMNTRPMLQDGVEASVGIGLVADSDYTVNLNDIFLDRDSDGLTYYVKVNDGAYAETPAAYSYRYNSGATETLVFTAADAKGKGATYTVTIVEEIDKSVLAAAIDSVTGDNAADWYQSNDRWNGKDVSTKGFWADMQPALTVATDVNTNILATQEQVDTAAANLNAAIAKLIPKDRVNATALYELHYREIVQFPRNEADYTAFSWGQYGAALTAAQEMLTSLYENGEPTAVNKAAYQATVDGVRDAILAAADKLCILKSLERGAAYYNAISALNTRLSGLKAADYDAAAWAAFAAARDAALAYRQNNAALTTANTDRPKAEQAEGVYKAFSDAYYKGLKSKSESITVKFRVADNLGAKYPNYAITDHATAVFDGEVSLTEGRHSLADLISAAGLDFSANMAGAGEKFIMADRFIYLNGILARDPYDGNLIGSFPPPNDGEEWDYRDFLLRNGDEIIFVRPENPLSMYYIHATGASYSQYKDYVATLRIGVDAAPIEVREGEAFNVKVERTSGLLTGFTGQYQPAANVSLLYGAPAAAKEAVNAAVINSGIVTDAEGEAAMALYSAGWYRVAAVDIRDQTPGSTDSNFNETPGVYPNLAAGDYVLVHVLPLDADALAAAKAGYLQELDGIIGGYDEAEFGSFWAGVRSAYDTAKTAIAAAENLQTARDALDTATAAMASLYEEADAANAEILDHLSWYLHRLPSIAEIEAGKFTQGDRERMQRAQGIYDDMTPYQRARLTGAQAAQYQTLAAAYGEDGAGLPAARDYALTLRTVPSQYAGKVEGQVEVWRWESHDASSHKVEGYPKQAPLPIIDDISPTDVPVMSFRLGDNADEYEIYKVECEGAEIRSSTTGGVTYCNFISGAAVDGDMMPRNDVTVKVYVRPVGEYSLEEAQNMAKQALSAAYNAYNKNEYAAAKWAELTQAYRDGVNAVAAAENELAVNTAKDAAIAAMTAIPKRAAGDLGQVTVSVENTTYDGAPAGFTGIIAQRTVGLDADDTMMTLVLDTLQDAGYTWEGSGGGTDPYAILYIASVNKDGYRLAETVAGPASGWMGTLNDWFTNLGFTEFKAANGTLKDGDVIRVMYTTNGYGEDIGGTWSNGDTSLKALTVNGGELVGGFDPEVTEYLLTLQEANGFLSLFGNDDFSLMPVAANKNFQVRTYLNSKDSATWYRPGDNIPVQAGDVIHIGCGERAWPSMNNQGAEAIPYKGTWYTLYVTGEGGAAVDQVITMIENLPAVNQVTLTDKTAVSLANAYYNALSAENKEKVTNFDKLTSLQERLQYLQEIEDVSALLSALPKAANVTLADAAQINAAKAAYEGLLPEQRDDILVAYVTNYEAALVRLQELQQNVPPAAYEEHLAATLPYIKAQVPDPKVDSVGGEWAVISLARGGVEDEAWYDVYLQNLKNYVAENKGNLSPTPYKYTEYARVTLAITSLGLDASAFEAADGEVYDLVQPLTTTNEDGVYYPILQGNNSTTFALIALNSANYFPKAVKARAAYIDSLAENQQENGGWPINADTGGFGVDVTGMVLQGLAPYYKDHAKFEALGAKTSYAELRTMVERGVASMKDAMGEGNDYGSSESADQVLVALAALDIDPEADGWSVLSNILTYAVEGGGFRHTHDGNVNQMATEQGAYALIAYDRYLKDKNDLYDMTDVFTYEEDPSESGPVLVKVEATRLSATTAAVKFTSNLPGTFYYAIAEAGAAAPAVDTSGKGAPAVAGVNQIDLTLDSEAAKDVYVVVVAVNGTSQPLKLTVPAYDDAVAITEQINALPTAITLADKDAVVAARNAYDALSDEAKARVPAAALKKLTDAEEALAALEDGDLSILDKYKDVSKTEWYAQDVVFVLRENIFKGVSEDSFAPNAPMTRAMFITVLGRYAGIADTEEGGRYETQFTDVNAGGYYATHLTWASTNGIVNGISDTLFAPNKEISREEMAAMIARFVRYTGKTLPDGGAAGTFADDGKIASWAREDVYAMKAADILRGKENNMFDPQADSTRAEVSAVMHRLISYFEAN